MSLSEPGRVLEGHATELTRPSGPRRFFGSLADLLLPPVCIVCRIRIEGHGLLCADCWSEILHRAAALPPRGAAALRNKHAGRSPRRRSPTHRSTTARVRLRVCRDH